MSAASGTVAVVGSVNLDLSWQVERLPVAGETVLSSGQARGLGGKGANAAVAAAALGVPAALVAAVGQDDAGRWLLDAVRARGVAAQRIDRVPGASGHALVVVDSGGENQIVVAPGANSKLTGETAGAAVAALRPRVVASQQEVPAGTVAAAMRAGRAAGATTVLNAAPARPVSAEVLADVDVLVVNAGEATALAGPSDPAAAAALLLGAGPRAVLVSLGARGALLARPGGTLRVPVDEALRELGPVQVVDTTGAGDVMTGALCAALAVGHPLPAATRLAVLAATWSVGHRGVRAPSAADLGLAPGLGGSGPAV